jgi:thiol:disulfide interchange protein DsbG
LVDPPKFAFAPKTFKRRPLTIWRSERMNGMFLCALSGSMIALSTSAIAGPDQGAHRQGVDGGTVLLSESASAAILPRAGSDGEPLALAAPIDIDAVPVLKHIASTGAQLLELGKSHGLRTVTARSGDQFMILQVAPDGQAVVGGPQLEIPVDKLMTLASGQVKELGETHGLRGLYLRNGQEFQVLYVAPDGKSTIAGVMWDATGKNLTREQVAKIDGAIPTMVVEKDGSKRLAAAGNPNPLLGVERATFGIYGDPAAPRLWMIFDPYCSYSIRAFDQLKPYVVAGRIQLALVPISILDYETNGQSTPAAESLLSQDPSRMAEAWDHQSFRTQPSPEAATLLRRNDAMAESIGLKGTPTLIWRKADGSAGEIDGIPKNWDALVAEVEGAHNGSAR